MALYLDTSLLVTLLTREPSSDEVEAWMKGQRSADFSLSGWVVAEFSSALSIKFRTGPISEIARSVALANFRRLRSSISRIYPVADTHFELTARFCDVAQTGLRAGDALHLAIAQDHGATVCTRDRGMASAGLALGIDTILLEPRSP